MFVKKNITVAVLACLVSCSQVCFAESSNTNWDALVNVVLGAVDNEKIYERFAKGQCTWYAWGRFREVNHKKIKFSRKFNLDAKLWPKLIVNCKIDDKPTEKSIAVSQLGTYGHLIFIEHIKDKIVYYTEANEDGNGLYDRGKDCVLKKTELYSALLKSFSQYIHP